MTEIATGQITSSAPPSAFFARWADMATWPEWNLDTEWVRVDGPFAQGATGTLKPKGGPKVAFVVEALVDGRLRASLQPDLERLAHIAERSPLSAS